MSTQRRSAWQELPQPVRAALSGAWRSGASVDSTALYARWWQLETWLRSLVYLEQSARDGRRWAETLPSAAEQREQRDARSNVYMASPDAQARLAYLDASPLLNEVLLDNWDLYREALIDDANVWRGRVIELLKIRHRIGHCRRPHVDDLMRVEQTLRDLEPGAFRAVTAYNRQQQPDSELDDPVVAAWCRGEHDDAGRLVNHATSNYEVRFSLRWSRRPWAARRRSGEPITGRPGYLWHARFVHTGGRPVKLRSFWDDSCMRRPRDLLVYVTANDPFTIEVSFAAVDDPAAIADAIGNVFDAVLTNPEYRWKPSLSHQDRWLREHRDMDPRVQLQTEWSFVDDSTVPITLFSA
jgi:hypothetical protein